MIVPGVAFDFVWHVVILASGLPQTGSTIYCYVRRKSDGYWLKADGTWTATTTAPTGADVPTATHTKGGLWKLTLSTTTTAALSYGEVLHAVAQDSETDASVTVASDCVEEVVGEPADMKPSMVFDSVESQRGEHTAQTGQFIYVGPVNGNDTTGNGTRTAPYKTVTKALSMVTSPHTCIYVLADQGNGVTTLTETIAWNQRYCFLRGPGRDLVIKGASSNTPTISVSVNGAEFSGFQLESHANGANADGIEATSADFMLVRDVWINATQGTGIDLINCSNCIIEGNTFQATGAGATAHGLRISNSGVGSSQYNRVQHNFFRDVQGDAVRLVASGAGYNSDNFICCNSIDDSTAYGVNIGANVSHTSVERNTFGNNASGDVLNNGTSTHRGSYYIDDLTTLNGGIISNITGNLSGSVGSVTGAVGSVTGAVGSVAAGGIVAASFGAGAIDAAALAADAGAEIADAVWDEALSGHTSSGTAGEALGLVTAGNGSETLTGTVHGPASLDIEGATVWAVNGSGAVVAKGTSDSNGEAVLNPGTGAFTVLGHASGYLFASTTATISPGVNQTATLTGTVASGAAASDPSMCTLYCTLRSLAGVAAASVTGYCSLVEVPTEVSDNFFSGADQSATSGADGLISWTVPRGATVSVRVSGYLDAQEVVIPDASTAELSTLL